MKPMYKVLSSIALAGMIGTVSLAALPSSADAAKAKTEGSTTVTASAETNKNKKAPAAVIKKVEQTLQKLTNKAYKLDKGSYLEGIGWDFNVLGTPFPSQLLVDLKGNIRSGHIQEDEISYFFEKNKISYTQENISIEDVNEQDIKAAEEVFGKLDLPIGELNGAVLQNKGNNQILEFMYINEDYGTWISVDQATHKVVGVNARALADDLFNKGQKAIDEYHKKMKKISIRQLQDSGVAQAELLLGLDLNGHMLKKEALPSDLVTFTKEGEPTVEGHFNSDGVFFSIQIVYN